MALPKLDTPNYSCVLPTLNKTVHYRPFLVGEQKVLLIAQESEDSKLQVREMMRLIDVCCDEVDIKTLPTSDLEYLFLQLRIKSIGETSDMLIPCEKCETDNPVSLNLEEAEVRKKKEIDSLIKLTDSVSIEIQYPSYNMIENLSLDGELNATELFSLMADCIVSVIDGDEIHTRDDFTRKELITFFDSMSLIMFDDVQQFFNSQPTLTLDVVFECSDCGVHNKKEMTGVGNFFV
jgi:hypothetical protein